VSDEATVAAAEKRGRHRERASVGLRLKRVALICATAFVTLNVWTGSPLLALWVGSRVQADGPPSMLAVGVVVVTLVAMSIALVRLLARLDAAYARLTGRRSTVHRHVPWLRSMRGERPHDEHHHASDLSPLEIILVTTVTLVVVLFEIWFFFYSPSPIDQSSGRSHHVPLIGAVATPDRQPPHEGRPTT
jgi:hypothetical protein